LLPETVGGTDDVARANALESLMPGRFVEDGDVTGSLAEGTDDSNGDHDPYKGQGIENAAAINSNEDPTITPEQSFPVSESSAVGDLVGLFLASDIDGDALNFTITSGNEAGIFAIGQNNGEIRIADPEQLDFETVKSYELGISVSDGRGGTVSDVVEINVIDANEAPNFTSTDVYAIDENRLVGTVVGNVVSTEWGPPVVDLRL